MIDIAINEMTTISGQKQLLVTQEKIFLTSNLEAKMPPGVRVTLRSDKMYEFLERLIRILPRIRDFKGINSKLDGRGNYTLGIEEQIVFPEIN